MGYGSEPRRRGGAGDHEETPKPRGVGNIAVRIIEPRTRRGALNVLSPHSGETYSEDAATPAPLVRSNKPWFGGKCRGQRDSHVGGLTRLEQAVEC